MPTSSNLKKWITGFSAIGGAMLFYPNDNHNSWITPSSWQNKWDHNWDRLLFYLFLICYLKVNIPYICN